MKEVNFEDVYKLGRYKNLLIYRKVAGIYTKSKPQKIPEGYYYQHINYHGRNYYFLYKDFSLGSLGFCLSYKSVRKKVLQKLEELLREIESETRIKGDDAEELEFFTRPLPDYIFAGLENEAPKENFSVIIKGNTKLIFALNEGTPLPKRSYELVFHPLFFFPSEDFPDFLEKIKKHGKSE